MLFVRGRAKCLVDSAGGAQVVGLWRARRRPALLVAVGGFVVAIVALIVAFCVPSSRPSPDELELLGRLFTTDSERDPPDALFRLAPTARDATSGHIYATLHGTGRARSFEIQVEPGGFTIVGMARLESGRLVLIEARATASDGRALDITARAKEPAPLDLELLFLERSTPTSATAVR